MAIKKNQVIKLNYELKINGEIVDNNIGADPIEFVYGAGDLIPGLESKIVDMNEGETKKIKVLAAEAYGEYNEELSEVVPKEAFEGIDLQIGLVLEADTEHALFYLIPFLLLIILKATLRQENLPSSQSPDPCVEYHKSQSWINRGKSKRRRT